MITINNSWAIN